MTELPTERREMYQIVMGHGFDRLSRFAPRRQAADDNEGVESLLAKQVRHTGAGGFALSSAIEVDVLILRKRNAFLRQVIRLNTDGAGNARRSCIVVPVA